MSVSGTNRPPNSPKRPSDVGSPMYAAEVGVGSPMYDAEVGVGSPMCDPDPCDATCAPRPTTAQRVERSSSQS